MVSPITRFFVVVFCLALAGCSVAPTPPPPVPPSTSDDLSRFTGLPPEKARPYEQAIETVAHVSEQVCLAETRGVSCDFQIYVNVHPQAPVNAYQSIDDRGRPEITLTGALIRDVNNVDELAFVMSHEAAHHILGHLQQLASNADFGSLIFSGLAEGVGASAEEVENARELGAFVGRRAYAKEFELQADAIGTLITYEAGYDPLVGAQYFNRISDPGDEFLGTHPPNSKRMEVVKQVVQEITQ